MGIKQYSHSQALSSSSGSGAKNARVRWPGTNPSGRFLPLRPAGTSLATGLPALAITTSLPVRTSSSRRER